MACSVLLADHTRRSLFLAGALLATRTLVAQQPDAFAPASLTEADYARAERLMPSNTAPLTFRAAVRPTFLPDDRFWYRNRTEHGTEFVLVTPSSRTRRTCDLPECQNMPGTDGARHGRRHGRYAGRSAGSVLAR